MPLFLFAAGGDSHTNLLMTLFVMFIAAKIAAEIFERLKQPAVAGEIIAGVIIGPSVLALVAPGELTNSLAEIGVIFLLFSVGLETRPGEMFKVGGRALAVAVAGVIVPFIAGYLLSSLWNLPQIEAIFVGAAMVATSVGITARVLGQMGLLHLQTSRIILGAAVIDDILGLIILAVVSSLAGGGVNYWQLAATAALATGFTVFVALVGARAMNRLMPVIERLKVGEARLIVGFGLCLGLAFVASSIGVAAIIGAFLAGMALSESAHGTEMPRQVGAVTELLLPFFLTNIGMQVNLSALSTRDAIILATLVTILAVLTKLVACGAVSLSFGLRRAAQVGIGMVPRGEVGVVVAQIGLSLGAITDTIYGVVLVMAVATTLIAPPFLTLVFKSEKQSQVETA